MASARDGALDALFDAAPADFVARRTELVRALRAKGATTDADVVEGRRKPTQIAYVLNQLARRHPDDVRGIGALGRELASAQRDALAKTRDAGALRAAMNEQRARVAALVARASEVAAALGVSVSRHELSAAFHAALSSASAGAALASGRLETAPVAGASFDADETESAVAPRARARTKRIPPKPKPTRKAEAKPRRDDRARVAAEKARAREEERAAVAREKAIARERAEAAAQRAREIEAREAERSRSRDARARATTAAREAAVAEREAKALERAALRARTAADAARAHADALSAAVEGSRSSRAR